MGVAAGAITVAGTVQFWWPGWFALADWFGAWWWTLLAAATALGGGVLLLVARRSAHPVLSSLVVWEQVPGQAGLVARTTPPAVGPVPTGEAQPRQRQDWSAIGSIGTAFAALAALVFTGLSLSATQQAQITDRYARAVDQIGVQGPDHLETRLGGIYALERLAHDSPRDQPTIVQVLSAFVRASVGQATALPDAAPDPRPCPPATTVAHPLNLDVQAALTVLGRRDYTNDNAESADLSKSCLNGVDLSGAHLLGANLSGANLAGANLNGANLAGANLASVNLSGASLSGAHLFAANLVGANLVGVDLSFADLVSTDLIGADLTGAMHNPATLTDSALTDGAIGVWW